MYSLEKKWLLLIGLLVLICFFNYTNNFTSCSNTKDILNSENKISNLTTNKTFKLIKVYNFNTSWCGYSVRFQPEWKKFEEEIKSINNLSIQAFDIKCDNIHNKQMCNDYEIPGFPTIIIEKDGNKINYNGLRTAKAIIETIQNL
jgi:thiol-disulfide isomerase/thioredoxin